MPTRRNFLINFLNVLEGSVVLGATLLWPLRAWAGQALPPLTVFKDPNCGCCGLWVEHMKAKGFTATVTNTDMVAVHAKHKIPPALQSCHTTLVGGYIVEGHVPASDVKTLLTTKPKGILGLTIPGMPASAPGMDIKPFQPYTVLTFDAQGKTAVFTKHTKPA